MRMTKKLLLTGFCIAALLLLPQPFSGAAFAADSDGGAEVSGLEMRVKSVTLKPGQDKALRVDISPSGAEDKTVTWESSDDRVANVQDTGGGKAVVTGVGEGKAKITATSQNGKTAVCNVTVSDDEVGVRWVELSQDTATVRVNQVRTIFAEVFPYNADDQSIEWSSGNPDVVTVTGDGRGNAYLVGIGPGTAKITATSHNGKTAVCTVTVPAAVLAGSEQDVSNADHPLAEVNGGEALSAATLRLDVENAAKKAAETKQITVKYAGKTRVSTAALRSAAYTAAYGAKEAALLFRTLDENGGIQGQLTIRPENVGKDDREIYLSVYASAKQMEQAKSDAEAYFGAPAAAVILSQEGEFYMTVQVAARSDLTGLNTEAIRIYRCSGGTYSLIENQGYRIDANGYIHFSVSKGGTYVLVSG